MIKLLVPLQKDGLIISAGTWIGLDPEWERKLIAAGNALCADPADPPEDDPPEDDPPEDKTTEDEVPESPPETTNIGRKMRR